MIKNFVYLKAIVKQNYIKIHLRVVCDSQFLFTITQDSDHRCVIEALKNM